MAFTVAFSTGSSSPWTTDRGPYWNPATQKADGGVKLPVVHRDTVDERFGDETLTAETATNTNMNGYPELEQFINLMAGAYSISPRAMLIRMETMLTVLISRSSRIAAERTAA